MPNDILTIKLTSNAQAILSRLDRFPPIMAQAIGRAMSKTNEDTIGHIVLNRFTGKGPFPVTQHKLGSPSGRLRASLTSGATKVFARAVETSIGSNVKYAGVHEFGFSGIVDVAKFARKESRRDVFGKTKSGKDKLLASGIAFVRAHKRNMKIPARQPIFYGVRDNLDRYSRAISDAIVTTAQQHLGGGTT